MESVVCESVQVIKIYYFYIHAQLCVSYHCPGSFFSEGHEAYIVNSCFVVGGLQSLLVSSQTHILTFGPGKEGSAKLLIPKGAIPQGQELRVRYAYLLDGPFSIPENYDIVSPVLYINYNTSLVKKPLELQLDHWYAGKDRQKNMAILKAPHVAQEGGIFPFTKYSQGSFSDEEQFAALNLEEDLCCVVLAVKNTGNLPYPANYRLHLLNKVQTCVCTSYRLYVTYDHSAWTEVSPIKLIIAAVYFVILVSNICLCLSYYPYVGSNKVHRGMSGLDERRVCTSAVGHTEAAE